MAAMRELMVADYTARLAGFGRVGAPYWGGTVMGVTGSAGKTTTKDAIAHLLSVEMAVGRPSAI